MSEQGMLRLAVHENDHSIGPIDAPVTIVEYGDYECPFCRQAHPIVRRLQRQFGQQLRFVLTSLSRRFTRMRSPPRRLRKASPQVLAPTRSGGCITPSSSISAIHAMRWTRHISSVTLRIREPSPRR